MIANWKPINTAPLDREIMVRNKDGYTAIVRAEHYKTEGHRWLISHSDFSLLYDATHWDDLPENKPE